MRCAWRTRHAAFWAALDTSAPGQFIMQKSSSDDDSNSGSDNEDVNSYLVPQFAGSAAASAARILNQAPAIQALIAPALQLRKPDIKHQAKFPFVTGGFDDDCVSVQWNSCNGQNICDIFTSKMFGSGRGAQKSMGVWARELMKHLKVQCRFHQSFPQRIEAVLEKVPKGTQGGQRSALQSDEFEPLLTEILAQSEFLPSARAFLVKHSRQHALHVVSSGFFPQISDVQVAQCRVGALMREPSLQVLFHEIANPDQSRDALQPGQDLVTVRTKNHMKFAEAFNNPALCPHHAVDVSLWINVKIDVALPPVTWAWTRVTEAMIDIKKRMTIVMKNFMGSGKLANDWNDIQRDLEFWNCFCHGDPVLFYVYMSWDHGRDIPAWNSALLPPNQRLEIGSAQAPALSAPAPQTSPSRKKRSRDSLDDFVNIQCELFQKMASNPSSATTQMSSPQHLSPCAEVIHATKSEALARTAHVLRDQIKCVPTDCAGSDPNLEASFSTLKQQLQQQLLAVMTQIAQVTVSST